MNINFNSTPNLQAELSSTTKPTSAEAQANFANSLKDAIENLNTIQNESNYMTNGLASGQVQDLHEVMITAQKASITLETTVQVQQKVIDAYNEIMRMQI